MAGARRPFPAALACALAALALAAPARAALDLGAERAAGAVRAGAGELDELGLGAIRPGDIRVCGGAGPCGVARALDDEAMAAVAGKFTLAGEVVGMNLVMASSWQADNGQRLEGRATLAVRFEGGQAQVRTGAEAAVSEAAAPAGVSGRQVGGGAGLDGVNGVAQLIQLAGDGNGASNRGTVEVGTAALADLGGNGAAEATYTAANGAQASARVGAAGAALRLTVPGAGLVAQQVRAGAAGLSGNIVQRIQIAADRQQVLNQLQLQVQMRPASGALQAAQGLAQSINMLRGR